MGTNFDMGPPPYPLEYILRDATAPGGAYHGNYGHETSVIVDYPFITGRSTPDSYLTGAEDGRGARERPDAVGLPSERRRRSDAERRVVAREDRTLRDRRAAARRRDHATCSATPARSSRGSSTRSASYPDMRYIPTLQETIAVAIGRRLRPRDAASRRVVQLHSGVGLGNGDRDDVPGEARRRAARRDRRRVGRPLRRDGRADGGRPRLDGAAGDQVGDARRRPDLDAARAAAGDQDRRARRRSGPSSSRCRWTCSTRRATRRSCRRRIPDTRVAPDAEAVARGGGAARRRASAR